MNSQFQANLRKLQNKLQKEKKNITIELINYYFNHYHKTDECEYIRAKKASMVWVDFLIWFGKNRTQRLEKFDFKQAVKQADKDLNKLRESIFNQWRKREFRNEIRYIENKKVVLEHQGKELPYMLQLKYELLKMYSKYREEDATYLREDLGLKL